MAHEVPLADGWVISDDRARLDLTVVHRFLAGTYWARERPPAATERAIAGSLCLGLYAPDGAQAGFARIVTDYGVRAHLADVFVLPAWRGHGFGQALVRAALDHPDLAGIGLWSLATDDAHALYAKFGFVVHPAPQTQMVLHRPPKG
ncbi:GNAT family N-acetyltransferase [Rhodovastum atsumiense]|uniref:GNAT family N-acetyltransferase n=1 Tax=Rhodovastum atsumiense TaxID=504468 RepID=A0A5M6ILL4_9PROT|nr:GNAT family N-acetyltransferase [Rhodovastum atsumiense]KAA5608817.1 GNAT family N-acetyltransferase [Rhodovastum atsumiense]CAH2600836.1 GNAT family N-acetyltransferase [Rhodovastum atsumiense]